MTINSPTASPLFIEDIPIPSVIYSAKAKAKQNHIITSKHKGTNEISWYGNIRRLDNGDIYIDDIFVPHQEVTGTSLDIPDINILVPEAMAQKINPMTLRAWCHLHPGTMGTSPSQTDIDQTNEYLDTWPYLLRGIVNNQGSEQFDFFDKETGLQYNDLNVFVDTSTLYDEESWEKTISERVKEKKKPVYPAITGKTKGGATVYSYYNDSNQKEKNSLSLDPDQVVYLGINTKTKRGMYVDLSEINIYGDDSSVYDSLGTETGLSISDIANDNLLHNGKTAWKNFQSKISMTKEEFNMFFENVNL